MSTLNKVLVGVIVVVAIAFFYLAARDLRTHEYWRGLANRYDRKIKTERQTADQTQTKIREVRLDLDKLLLDRRRAWFNCDPKVAVNRADGSAEVVVTIEQPDPHGIADKTVVRAFEEADVQKRGRYLGEFKVTKTDGKQIVLAPTLALDKRELDRLAVAKRPWVIYEIMPRDSHDIFAGLSEADMKALFPADSLAEYLKDGKPATADDPPDRVVDGKYVRQLRDYQLLLDADIQNRAVMTERFEGALGDKKLVDDALALAKQGIEADKAAIAATTEEKTTISGERKLVADLAAAIDGKLLEVQLAVADLLKNNKAMAGQIAKQQLEAARRIDERTRAMAQSGTGER